MISDSLNSRRQPQRKLRLGGERLSTIYSWIDQYSHRRAAENAGVGAEKTILP